MPQATRLADGLLVDLRALAGGAGRSLRSSWAGNLRQPLVELPVWDRLAESSCALPRRGRADEWQVKDKARPVRGCVLDMEGAVVGVGDAAGDGQSQSGAAVITAAGGVQAGEALEDVVILGFRDSRTIVSDAELRLTDDAAYLHHDGVRGVALGVVEQIVQNPTDLRGDDIDHHTGVHIQAYLVAVAGTAADFGFGEFGQVDALEGGRRDGAEPVQQHQIVNDGLEPVHIAQRMVDQFAQVGLVGMQLCFLQLCTQSGKRGAQLMGGIGGESPLEFE